MSMLNMALFCLVLMAAHMSWRRTLVFKGSKVFLMSMYHVVVHCFALLHLYLFKLYNSILLVDTHHMHVMRRLV